jgi:hypothetical protein
MSCGGSVGSSSDLYERPESVPASHGYVSISKLASQVSLSIILRFKKPVNQSGDGEIFVAVDMNEWSESTMSAGNFCDCC